MDLPTEIIPHIHRPATPKDFEKVYDLYMDRSSNPYLTYDQMDKPEFEKIYNEILPSNTLFVVELDDKVIASYRLIPKKARQAHTIYLGGFVVDRSMQGRGIGNTILNRIKLDVANKGKSRIELTVDIHNEAAIKLYQKTGFEIKGRIRNSYKRVPGDQYLDEYLMGLIL